MKLFFQLGQNIKITLTIGAILYLIVFPFKSLDDNTYSNDDMKNDKTIAYLFLFFILLMNVLAGNEISIV